MPIIPKPKNAQPLAPEPEQTEADLEPYALVYKGRATGKLYQGFVGARHVVFAALRNLLTSNKAINITDELVFAAKDFTFTPGELEIGDVVGAMSQEAAVRAGIP